MLSYLMLSAYDEARLREQECAAMARLRFDRRERRWLRGRLDASRVLLARRERKLLDQNSVVVQVAAGGKLRAPSEHATRQFLLLEQGCAEMTAEGASARELTPGDLVGHAPGVTVRATTDLRVRVLTPREHDVVKTIPSLHGRTVEPLQRAA